MAVYQGARLRATAVPSAEAPAFRRRAARPAMTSPPRIRPAASLVATILVATILGLVYLTQTLGANASSVEIASLAAQRESFQRQLLNQRSLIAQQTTDGRIEAWAEANGLVDLGEPVIVDRR